MKFKKTEETQLLYSLKNMRISNKKRRHIQKNIQIGAKLFATIPNNENLNRFSHNYKPYYRPINLHVSRYRRLSAQEGADNCSPTRAYHSDSETVVRKEKESSYRSQKNLFSENEINFSCILQADNCTPLNTEQSDYLSSDSSYPPIKEDSSGISNDIYQFHPCHNVNNINNNNNNQHPDNVMKRFSLRESSTSLFGSNLIDPSKSASVERSPSLQHIGGCCSSIDASPSFRTPMSTISGGNYDQLTATTASSSRVSSSSGYSHSGVFHTGYSSDDFHLLQQRHHHLNLNLHLHHNHNHHNNHNHHIITNENHATVSKSTAGNNHNIIQSNILSVDVDLPRPPQNVLMFNSGDSSSGMEDLSAYMDLMIHIPKMHL